MPLPRPNQHSGPLAGHVRKGRVYKPPLVATGAFATNDWIRNDLPDLMWPVLVLADAGLEQVMEFVGWQRDVIAALGAAGRTDFVAGCLDGRLTGLDRLIAAHPDVRSVVVEAAARRGLLSPAVRAALAVYLDRPAAWLTADHAEPGAEPEWVGASMVGRGLFEVLTDGHREALIKCLQMWAADAAGTLLVDPMMRSLLDRYPEDRSIQSRADAMIRASWGGTKGRIEYLDPDRFDSAARWAIMFWRTNMEMTRCIRASERPPASDGSSGTSPAEGLGGAEEGIDNTAPARQPEPPTNEPSDASLASDDEHTEPSTREHAGPTPMPEDGQHLREVALDLWTSYLEVTETATSTPANPQQQEVHTGLVARAARDVIAVLGAPDLWCSEHGSSINRMLVEVRIYLGWMATQSPDIYRAFQEYGSGKAKLYARIMEEMPAEDRQPGYSDGIEEMNRLSHNNDLLDVRTVDVRDSFAGGKSIRTMADESGLLDLYRRAYQQASGVTHSEWWSVEVHAMERCVNVMHAGHLIPSLNLNYGGNVAFAQAWLDMLYAVMRASLRILGSDRDAVQNAFAWCTGDDPAV